MKQNSEAGMRTFDQVLYALYAAGIVGYAERLSTPIQGSTSVLQIRLQEPPPLESARGAVDGIDLPLSLQLGK